jgi:hypothetical protein
MQFSDITGSLTMTFVLVAPMIVHSILFDCVMRGITELISTSIGVPLLVVMVLGLLLRKITKRVGDIERLIANPGAAGGQSEPPRGEASGADTGV